jgi:hypothetical protein
VSPPRVSILLPAWNAADCIGLARESIRRQTERAWECVVLDDGSEDGTAIVRRFATVDARVRVLTRPHRGLIRTRQPHRPTLYDRPVHACKAHYLATGFISAVGRFVLWGYGSTGRLLCAALLAHGKHPYAIVEV